MSISELHPTITPAKIIYGATPDDNLMNTGAVIQLAKMGQTPEARALYRAYLAEFRALEGQPLTHERREVAALTAAFGHIGARVVQRGDGR